MSPGGRLAALLACAWLGSACTTIGVGVPGRVASLDFGARLPIRVCVLNDAGVSEARARQLVAEIDAEIDPYGLDVVVPWVRPWRRPGFTEGAIMGDLVSRRLEPPCDRLLAFVGRNAGDVLWGLLPFPEVLGAVDSDTHTRGYVVARFATLSQLFLPPSRTARHEFYHMLGCGHALTKSDCYEQIRATKSYHPGGDGFLPGLSESRAPIRTREQADALLRAQLH